MAKILYIGDTALDNAACYLAGVMTHFGIDYDYIANGQKCGLDEVSKGYDAFVISDYPAEEFEHGTLEKIKEMVAQGTGLFMPGGWDSYVGLCGHYNRSPLAEVLPVKMKDSDDRVNSYNPCLVIKEKNHPIIDKLNLATDLPGIGGYNEFETRQHSELILSSQRYSASVSGDEATFEKLESRPLLVVGSYGEGRVASLATDLAPHWVGGLVDWGKDRVCAHAKGSVEIEVGSDYATLMSNIVKWVAKEL
ncbi:MAG: glutamine amidotransferase [Sedimentisphaeraceae bacterium JB056]